MPRAPFPREEMLELSRQSRALEDAAYGDAVSAYDKAYKEGVKLFRDAHRHTEGFARIDADSLHQDESIVAVLRHLMRPYVAQDRLGQLAGLRKGVIQRIEAGGYADREALESVASVIRRYLDSDRLPWLAASIPGQQAEAALSWVERWTASSYANITARKAQRMASSAAQEDAIAKAIADAGWNEATGFEGLVSSVKDIPSSSFTREKLVRCRTPPNKKADSVVRLDEDRLLLIEAKHNIDELNARKRVAEIRDKATKWRESLGLEHVVVGAVISGYFPEDELQSLWEADVLIFWEHDLAALVDWLRQNGSPA